MTTPPPTSPPTTHTSHDHDHSHSNPDSDTDSLDSLLPPSPKTASLLSARLHELRATHPPLSNSTPHTLSSSSALTTLATEPSLISLLSSSPTCILHFFSSSPPFPRCSIMDTHLALLAGLHPATRFLRVDVKDAPFLVQRYGVRVLPCVLGFVDGRVGVRIVGFEGLGVGVGGTEGFRTGALEGRLVRAGVLEREEVGEGEGVGEEEGEEEGDRERRDESAGEDDGWD